MQQVIETHLPHLTQSQLTGLPRWVCGTIPAGSACQNAAASALSTRGDWNSLRQCLREWLYDGSDRARPCRTELDVSLCFAPLPRWVLAWWRSGRLAPAVDPTLQGDDTTASVISVVCRGCAIPVAWRILRANQRGAWMDPMVELLRELAPAVPREMTREMTVVALCDRVDVRTGPADPAVGVFQGVAQAVVETLAVELGLADMVAPAPVGAADSRVQGFRDTEPCPGLGRSFQSSPVLARMRASVARFVAPQLFSAALRLPLGEHLQRVGLELAGVLEDLLEDLLDAVGAGGHGVILPQVHLPQVHDLFRQNGQSRAVSRQTALVAFRA